MTKEILVHVCYSRKSSEAREKQALSIPDQNKENEKYAYKEGLNIAFKLEESKSAFKPHIRPEFDKMLALIESGQANAILTWHLNRLCRNPEEGGKILQLLQDGKIKEIRTASGEIYTPESDHLVLQIHFGMANQYSRNISRDVRRGLLGKCERGQYPSPAPLGFEGFGEIRSRNIKPHPFEAQMIKEVFQMAATARYSLRYLTNFILKKGLKTKRDKNISKSHLHNILTCPTYYGYFYHKGELFKGDYEPIIPKQLFDAVQKALKDRSKPRITSWTTPYNGLAKCPSCESAITTTVKVKYYKRTNNRVTYIYLHCTRRKGHCDQPPISVQKFENELSKKLGKITIDEKVWSHGLKLLKEKHKQEATKNMAQLNHIQLKYKGLQDKLNRLIDMRTNGELTKEEFISQKEFLLQEQAKLKSLLDENEMNSRNWLELAENFLNVAFYARDTLKGDDRDAKRELIMDVGENLYLRDKKLEFSFKKPYDILLIPKYRLSELPD